MSIPPLLVGGGHVELPGGWDAGPLVLALVVVLGMRVAGISLRPASILWAVVAGLTADVAIAALDLPLVPTVSVAMVVIAALALHRVQQQRRGPQGV